MFIFNRVKRLLYVSENRLGAWHWHGGKLSRSGDFNADAGGLADFSNYLAQSPDVPIAILVDAIEEDFRNETIPHILGKDRQALIARKLNQLFRATAYRHASPQGRETEGRRDDLLLLTGLTNEALITPWVECILKLKQPLAGIWSLPLLNQAWSKKLGLAAPHQLLITQQASSGLRQSYFQEGQLKFSRLTLLSADNLASIKETVSREASRTQQYLNSLRLLPRDAALDIVVFGAKHLLQLQPEAMSTPLLRYQAFHLEDIIARFGFKAPAAELTSEMLYLHLLGRYPPPQHYASPSLLWYRRLRLARAGILGVTALLLAAGGYVAGQNIDQALDDYRQSEKISRETQDYFNQYQAIKNTFPPTPATPENMKNAVELMHAAHDKDVMPERLLALVSQALETSRSIKLNQIKWRASDTPDGEPPPDRQARAPTVRNAPPSAENGVPGMVIGVGKSYQIAVIDGEVSPFTDYRSALAEVSRFMDALNKLPALQASARTLPIDIRSLSSLQGRVDGKTQEKALFSVQVVLSPAPVRKDEGGGMKDEMRKSER